MQLRPVNLILGRPTWQKNEFIRIIFVAANDNDDKRTAGADCQFRVDRTVVKLAEILEKVKF